MYVMRQKLQNTQGADYSENFTVLFQAFKYNPASVTSLCLLAKQYQLAYRILVTFSSELEMSQRVLVDFCKLAGLLESPGFLRTRFST
jgi:vacuole morphology and inheritance protein 14